MGFLLNASGLRHQASRPGVDPGRAGWSPRTGQFARATGMGRYRTTPEATTVRMSRRLAPMTAVKKHLLDPCAYYLKRQIAPRKHQITPVMYGLPAPVVTCPAVIMRSAPRPRSRCLLATRDRPILARTAIANCCDGVLRALAGPCQRGVRRVSSVSPPGGRGASPVDVVKI